jgi:hypothetical protein
MLNYNTRDKCNLFHDSSFTTFTPYFMALMDISEPNRSLLSITSILLKPMSLFPEANILTKEIESWKGFVNSLKSEDDRKLFPKMLEDAISML